MAAEQDALRLDLDELRHLQTIAKRPRVLSFLSSEICNLDAKLSKDEAAIPAAVPVVAGKSADVAAALKYVTLSSFSYDQDNDKIKIYVFLEGVAEEKVESNFKPMSLDIKFHDVQGKNYRCAIPKLNREIVPDKCKVLVKPNKVIITLFKASKGNWLDLHFKEDKMVLTRNENGVNILPPAQAKPEGSEASSAPNQSDTVQTMANILQQQQQFFQAFLQVQAQQTQAQHVGGAAPPSEEELHRRAIRDFRSLAPKVFSGELNPVAANLWLRDIVKDLETLAIDPARWVTLASFQLQGQATIWWNSVRMSRGEGQPALQWDEFSRLFKAQYVPVSARRKLATDFNNLQQGNVSVYEYVARFLELLEYVPSVAAEEEEKTFRFVDGLRPTIRILVSSHIPNRFQDAVDRALAVELSFEKAKSQQEGASTGGNMERGGGSFHRNPTKDSRQSQHLGVRDKGKKKFQGKCLYCGLVGHMQKDCHRRARDARNPPAQAQQQVMAFQPLVPMLPAPSYQPQPLQMRPPSSQQWTSDARLVNKGKAFAIHAQDPSAVGSIIEVEAKFRQRERSDGRDHGHDEEHV